MDKYGLLFSDGIEMIGRVLTLFASGICVVITVPFILAFAIIQSPFVLLGYVGSKCGFKSDWWPGPR